MSLPVPTSIKASEENEHLPEPTVILRADVPARDFVVNRKLLCLRSVMFDKTFDGRFREGPVGITVLDDIDHKLIKIFVNWLHHEVFAYTTDRTDGDMAIDFEEDDTGDDEIEDSSDDEDSYEDPETIQGHHHTPGPMKGTDAHTWHPRTLLRLYFFGERYDICQLRNHILCLLRDIFQDSDTPHTPNASDVHYVFDNTSQLSRLRKFIIEIFAHSSQIQPQSYWRTMPKRLLIGMTAMNAKRFPQELCTECTARAHEEKGMSEAHTHDIPLYERDMCSTYHIHKDDEEREKCSWPGDQNDNGED